MIESLTTLLNDQLEQDIIRWYDVLVRSPKRWLLPIETLSETRWHVCPHYQCLLIERYVLEALNIAVLSSQCPTIPTIKIGRSSFSQPRKGQPFSRHLGQSFHLSLDKKVQARWVNSPFESTVPTQPPTLDELFTLDGYHHRRFVSNVVQLVTLYLSAESDV